MSYHVVVEIYTNKKVNHHIANLLNFKIGKFPNNKGINVGVVDMKVYSPNHTMRLPNCVKIDDRTKQIENRKLRITQPSEFRDFFITDT